MNINYHSVIRTSAFYDRYVMSGIDDYLEQLSNQHKTKQENINRAKTPSSSVSNNSMNTSDNNDIDSYLSELEGSTQKTTKSKLSSNNSSKSNQKDNTDDLLSAIENQYQTSQKSSVSSPDSKNKNNNLADNLLNDIEAKFTQNKRNQKTVSSTDSAIVDNSIQQILNHTNSKKQKIRQTKTVDNVSDIREKELGKQREVKQLERKAEEWLKNLDPDSDEGFWFEQFAMSYESRFQAAIEYVKALS